jgi:DUF1680 family protein
MEEVKLLKGLFETSQEKGKEYLLYLDVDRLIAPCYEAAGKTAKKPKYGGWESKPISGHSLGHFLSALAAMYRATQDIVLKEKLDYAVSEIALVQSFDSEGYVSGFPRACFDRVFTGEFEVSRFSLGDSWVPWYSIHKIYAGLIDAYLLTDNQQALEVLIKLADWANNGLKNLTQEQFDRMLFCEHGGMCESMAKLYEITGNKEYLNLSMRFYHKETMLPLVKQQDELEGKHANTQIPKVIGSAKLYELTGDEDYKKAALFFWNSVTKSRSYAIGGNSRDEHFGKSDTEKLGVTTAETCNTYNMMKLTEYLFSWNQDSEYMDYYENALYNHILASQDPDSGMKMYFVSTQPGHFKVYCSADNSFWCCTGTGMENPARYIRQIYYRNKDELFVNLYIASKINFEDKGIILRQETSFPETDTTKLVFEQASGRYMSIKLRVPYWAAAEVTAVVNGDEKYSSSERGYITISKNWKSGDTIEVKLPMNTHIYVSKEDSSKIAFMYGPLVLAGALGTENFPETDILEDHQKLNNYPGIIVPTLVTNDSELAQLVSQVKGLLLTFETKAISQPGDMKCKLIPFYALHHQRYTIYWTKMTKEEYSLSQLASPDYQQRLDKVTLDTVNPNEQQSEIDHIIKSENSTADYFSAAGKGWRESNNAGYFSYQMGVNPQSQMYLVVTYWGSDRECFRDGKKYLRNFNISIDNNVISNEILNENKPYTLYDEFYAIPQQFTKDKSKIEVRFSCDEKSVAGRVFGIRITTEKI